MTQTGEAGTAPATDERFRAQLLLHSMAELREVILPCLDMAGARSVVEVGAEDGIFTRELLAWAEQRDGSIQCVDPRPSPGLVELCEGSTLATLVQQRSPAALEGLEHADAYLIDGDHNYYTVSGELATIGRKSREAGRPFLVFLNDTGWPCGRRDLYYSPESLPADAVHPYSYELGVTLGSATLVRGGLRGQGELAFALEEGGPANGVMTAVEDFLQDRPDLALANVPCVFGLGVIYERSAPYAERLAQFLEPYDGNPLLDRLEMNRLSLYLRVLELDALLEECHLHLDECRLHLRDLAAENRALWARTAELEAQLGVFRAEMEHLLHSRAFAAAERLAALSRVGRSSAARSGPGLTRQRLRALLGDHQELTSPP